MDLSRIPSDWRWKRAVRAVGRDENGLCDRFQPNVAMGVKSEGELVVSGTDGYIYVPAPWWKMDDFEERHENPALNRRYFH